MGAERARTSSKMKNTIVKDCYFQHGYVLMRGLPKTCRDTENVNQAII
jgi:hypothetical protein